MIASLAAERSKPSQGEGACPSSEATADVEVAAQTTPAPPVVIEDEHPPRQRALIEPRHRVHERVDAIKAGRRVVEHVAPQPHGGAALVDPHLQKTQTGTPRDR